MKYIFDFIFKEAKKTGVYSRINVCVSVIQIVLNFFLIRHYKIYGAIFVSIVTNALISFLYFIFGKKYFVIPYDFKRVMRLFTFVLMIGCFGYILKDITVYYVLLKIGLVAIFVFGSLRIMNFEINNMKEILHLRKRAIGNDCESQS